MEPIQDFARLISRLRAQKERKRVAVVCPNDRSMLLPVACTKGLPISCWWLILPIY